MKKKLLVIFFIWMTVLAAAANVYPEQLRVQFNEHKYNQVLNSSFYLKGNISYDTIDAIRNGITARFYITVQLLEKGSFLGMGKNVLKELVEIFIISYDVWENNFVVQNKKTAEKHNVESSTDIITVINQTLSPLKLKISPQKRDERLFLRAKVRIQTLKLYPPLGIFLYFFDPWNYESEWTTTQVFSLDEL
ncbi:MAG: DUF4390 domain-containing protein [Spirochaetota bacterium]